MDNCIFCKIVRDEIPNYKVYEDSNFLAFLSSGPHRMGHTLIIPKEHTEYYFDLPEETLKEMVAVQKKLANAIKKAFNPKSGKVGVIVAGLEVPHAHLHLIPMDEMEDLNFGNSMHNVSKEEFLIAQEKIKNDL
ncbi:MAG: hypothetical protein ACD_30C00052G0023 [uncultured bacterium]|uniref:Histidine triad (HIT) protein n=4 Tax=Candidatus Daviesiibacteriota TaxID=1752718 RepID=A0A0G0HZE8_9BACT|nr:MAG: hypothetical protein ACD_30C00052G0023 [uncultured bacterium]KKQ09206.1 MAG: Histidine triad (HIT) protein [Candidatus Daviesbacteria bacterium GW2011_GWB1_36_5]KKQ14804.1 MAG: Histidine triad (HIT) protein [Candidatus Daviesbacteria bacterium GW2011_GWA1_36_8]OGE17435.1 MAG: hypothetical protein A2858_00090 [Candidatus Daviesbacteria bacterium RIFCSPHIGHO2_01_FULL_36_37]OGE35313.1 MAG: hypothetical protein A3E66_00450 [Candidatus Daviesbacteria bacterium RIFCSPHIGHO2_12_FULL_37_16]